MDGWIDLYYEMHTFIQQEHIKLITGHSKNKKNVFKNDFWMKIQFFQFKSVKWTYACLSQFSLVVPSANQLKND